MMTQEPTFEKCPADSVPYGDAVSTRGGYVWVAFEGERIVCVGATKREAEQKYRRIKLGSAYRRAPLRYPSG